MSRPRVDQDGQKELNKIEDGVSAFQEKAREFDPFKGLSDVQEIEPQTKISTREANSMDAQWIKPVRSIKRPVGGKDNAKVYFDEKYRKDYEEDWRYVKCIVENNEIIGEAVEVWTGKWGCDPCHFWKVPVNKPVMIPKLLAEQLSNCKYHRLKMADGSEKQNYVNASIVQDHVVRRIDARPVGFGFI